MGKGYTYDDAEDLHWFFNEATADLSMPSSYGAMVARLNMGRQVKMAATSDAAENGMDRRIDAARRYRRIEAAIDLLSEEQQQELEESFERRPCPKDLQSHPREQYRPAVKSEALRSFMVDAGGAANETNAIVWLVRAERRAATEKTTAEQLEKLAERCWAEAETAVDEMIARYAAAKRLAGENADAVRAAQARSQFR